MDWKAIGGRIRQQREYMGYTREQFSELIDVTPKFCSDIELGVKGMSVPTLYRIAQTLRLPTDYFLSGETGGQPAAHSDLLDRCSPAERGYAEQILRTFLMAMNTKKDPL